jgi:hypothetical protein
MARRRSPASTVALAALCALAGCGLGAGPAPLGARLDVTRGFGARPLISLRAPRVEGEETVMSLLLRNAAVRTRYGGGFVESIDGRSGGREGGDAVDWFFYVDGLLAPKGAAETTLRAGDRVWWDLHDWSAAAEVPAVVGSFPEPFLHGLGGPSKAVRMECARLEGGACRTVAARLRAAQVRVVAAPLATAGSAPHTPAVSEPHTPRVLVGPWAALRGSGDARALGEGPGASGVYARPAASGRSIALLDAHGAVVRTLAAGAGLIAAVRSGGAAPEWFVTGTDSAGVERAARDLSETALSDRFAVAVAADGAAIGLPVARTGR